VPYIATNGPQGVFLRRFHYKNVGITKHASRLHLNIEPDIFFDIDKGSSSWYITDVAKIRAYIAFSDRRKR
jgi:hypothetical protein